MHSYSDLDADQLHAIRYIREAEDSLIAADVGTGKTVVSLTAAAEALARGEVTRWLVLAPTLVATDTWPTEVMDWSHLSPVDSPLRMAVACGNKKQRLAAINSSANVVVMNYENLSWLMSHFPKPHRGADTLPFDGLICDEIDKLKSVSSGRFKEMRRRIWTFRKRIGLTGTLVPNSLTEVWGQVYMVDGGQTFGRSFYKWRKKYFYPTDFQQRQWAPFPDTRATLITMMQPMCLRLKAAGLPDVVFSRPSYMPLPGTVRAHYAELEKEYFLALDDNGRERIVDAANAAVLSGKLQQICAGFSYVDKSRDAVWHSYSRFNWLEKVLETAALSHHQVLIFYHFNEERDELLRRYPAIRFLGGGASIAQKRATIAAWNAGKLPFMALHPASAGHGLNLQKSGAHHIAFLTMPWSGGMFKQVVGRLARRGQSAETIRVHTALFKDTIDEDVFERVTGRLGDMEDFLDDLTPT